METAAAKPPANAKLLFNGKDLKNWKTRDGKPAGWEVKDGVATVLKGTGDIVTDEKLGDFFLHLEFRSPSLPEAKGQAKGNSGVYLQGRYEIQVLDSSGWAKPGKGDCGGVYDMHAPLVNACRPGGEWQAYDIVFRQARLDGQWVVEKARVTVFLNGVAIVNNAVIWGPTGGAIDRDEGKPGSLLLQDHGDRVSYRNVWAVELPPKGSDIYQPE